MNDYIDKRMSGVDLEQELLRLIAEYNKLTGNYLLVYSAAMSKPIPGVSLGMDDYYIIADLLRSSTDSTIDVYLETPGGSGEAAEEIVKFLRSRFENVNFIISGEAKSAGTLMALSGDAISMTKTGSLGPVDAQVVIGRGQVSAHDYIAWIDEKQQEAKKTGQLNPFDATMIAQISPGELNGVSNALEFAHDLVVGWLPKYKFKQWDKTETSGTKVTDAMKRKRAREIAKALTDHSKWRSHGRSLKIEDLETIGLKIDSIEDNPEVCEIVNRIQVVLRLLFSTTNTYKVFSVEGSKIFVTATIAGPGGQAVQGPAGIGPQNADNVQLELPCPKCGRLHKRYLKFLDDPKIDKAMQAQGFKKLPADKIICDCGFEINTDGIINQIETESGRKVIK
jgi:hypothetical protein